MMLENHADRCAQHRAAIDLQFVKMQYLQRAVKQGVPVCLRDSKSVVFRMETAC